MLELVRQEQSQHAGPASESERGQAPAKVLSLVARIVAAQSDAGDATLLRAIGPVACTALEGFPEDILSQVRNRRLYRVYLKGVIGELLGLLDLAWASNPPAIETSLC